MNCFALSTLHHIFSCPRNTGKSQRPQNSAWSTYEGSVGCSVGVIDNELLLRYMSAPLYSPLHSGDVGQGLSGGPQVERWLAALLPVSPPQPLRRGRVMVCNQVAERLRLRHSVENLVRPQLDKMCTCTVAVSLK